MEQDRSHNDWIVLAMVGVLALLLIGMVALAFTDRSLGEESYVVAGAIVGVIGGYITAGRSKHPSDVLSGSEYSVPGEVVFSPPNPGSQTPDAQPADRADPPASSATEAYGPDEGGYEDVSEEWDIR